MTKYTSACIWAALGFIPGWCPALFCPPQNAVRMPPLLALLPVRSANQLARMQKQGLPPASGGFAACTFPDLRQASAAFCSPCVPGTRCLVLVCLLLPNARDAAAGGSSADSFWANALRAPGPAAASALQAQYAARGRSLRVLDARQVLLLSVLQLTRRQLHQF